MRIAITLIATFLSTLAHAGEAMPRAATPDASSLSSIGTVNVAFYNRRTSCTGALIAPNLVLTAAECVVDPTTRDPVSAKKIHFLAGVDRDTYIEHGRVACVRFGDGYVFQGPQRHLVGVRQEVPASAYSNSVAVLVLEQKMASAPLPLSRNAGAVLTSGRPLVQAGYGRLQRYKIAQRSCTFSKSPAGSTLWNGTCDREAISFGAPLLSFHTGTASIVGITPSSFDAVRPLGLQIGNADALLAARCEQE